ncbi:ankyrin repeat-containing protein [Anaeramoeba flamelloides]|uniref:Ankyrin repeat-containing protein n=1 Tax=Anaeramoeba flamelloides TaxID=1746091 RepID=A0AAV7Z2D0_9EUKA|nr:ankyrin repeat-containing protein [Anaeramoeba flamelloides]
MSLLQIKPNEVEEGKRYIDRFCTDSKLDTTFLQLSPNSFFDSYLTTETIKYILPKIKSFKVVSENDRMSFLHFLFSSPKITMDIAKIVFEKFDEKRTRNYLKKKDLEGNTPFHYLCLNASHSCQLIEYCMTLGANCNLKNKYSNTPFHLICEKDHLSLEVLEMMLQKGANPKITNTEKNNCFSILCQNETTTADHLKLVLKKDGRISQKNIHGKNALHILCQNVSVSSELIKIVINHNESLIWATDRYNTTPLWSLLENGNPSLPIIELLETILSVSKRTDQGAYFRMRENQKGNNLLMKTISNTSLKSKAKILSMLMEYGADPNQRNKEGYTVLNFFSCLPSEQEVLDCLKVLLINGLNLNVCPNKNSSPAILSFLKPSLSMDLLKLILKYSNPRANFNVKYQKMSFFERICMVEVPFPVLQYLLTHEIKFDGTPQDRDNILKKCVQSKFITLEKIKLFLSFGLIGKKNYNSTQYLYYLCKNFKANFGIIEYFVNFQIQFAQSRKKTVDFNNENLYLLEEVMLNNSLSSNLKCYRFLIKNKITPYKNDYRTFLNQMIYKYTLQNSYKKLHKKDLSCLNYFLEIVICKEFQPYCVSSIHTIKKHLEEIIDYPRNYPLEHYFRLGDYTTRFRTNEKLEQLFRSFTSFEDDFQQLFLRNELTTIEVKGIKAHWKFIEQRIPNITKENFLEILSKYTEHQIEHFFKWAYGFKDYDSKETQNIFQDFSILNPNIEDTKLPIHKFVLQARSDLYRGMFISISDNIQQVKDYSKRSKNSINQLIKFFYYDTCDIDENMDSKQELLDAVDYYQLNENSRFDNYFL